MRFGPRNYIIIRNKDLWIVACLRERLFGGDTIWVRIAAKAIVNVAPGRDPLRFSDEIRGAGMGT